LIIINGIIKHHFSFKREIDGDDEGVDKPNN